MERKRRWSPKGNYDIIRVSLIDEKNNAVYFIASPDNATQKYLFKTRLDGKGKLERLTPVNESGTHEYDLSPNGQYALHSYSNANMGEKQDWVSLPGHQITGDERRWRQ